MQHDNLEHLPAADKDKGKSRTVDDEQGISDLGKGTGAKKLLIMTTGSRGDVQPFLALGNDTCSSSPKCVVVACCCFE
jgi:hypothetical protein